MQSEQESNYEKPITPKITKGTKKIFDKKTVKELKDIILITRPDFFEIDFCDLEKIEEHYRQYGYKPKEHGYIELRQDNIIGALRVVNKSCLVALFVKFKQENKLVDIKWRDTRKKPNAR